MRGKCGGSGRWDWDVHFDNEGCEPDMSRQCQNVVLVQVCELMKRNKLAGSREALTLSGEKVAYVIAAS